MKTNFRLPPLLRKIAYQVIPERRAVTKLVHFLDSHSLSYEETQAWISKRLLDGKTFSVGRPGGTESEGLYHFVNTRFHRSARKYRRKYSQFFIRFGSRNSGIVTERPEELEFFLYKYLQSCLSADLLAYGFFAPGALGVARSALMAGIPVSNYEHLEPWRALEARIEPWTLSLAGKKVLVVHPFEKSIQRNFENRKNISGLSEFLPEFELKTLRPPLTLSRGEDRSWKASFRELVSQVGEVDFDVALVGAGSYGLPLANEIRLLGKSAIHTAGATQLFFGLPGVRWAQGYAVSKFIDATWLPPLSEEVTPEIRKIEGGSYHQ